MKEQRENHTSHQAKVRRVSTSALSTLCDPRGTEFGRFITDYRVAKGLRGEDVAKAGGLPESSVRLYETGRRVPLIESCLKLAKGLGADPEIIFEAALKQHITDFIQSYREKWESFKEQGSPLKGPVAPVSSRNKNRSFVHIPPIFEQAREGKGWNRSQLAKEVGCTVSYIKAIEDGTTGMRFDRFRKICACLSLDEEQILRGIVWDSVETWKAALREHFLLCKDAKGVEKFSPVRTTKTAEYIDALRSRFKIPGPLCARKIGIRIDKWRAYQDGSLLFSFGLILKVARFSGDPIDDIFMMTLKDRIAVYCRSHREHLRSIVENKSSDLKKRIRFAENFKSEQQSPFYLVSSNYLRQKRKKMGLNVSSFAALLDVDNRVCDRADQGKTSLDFSLILSCSELFGEDPYTLLDMVLKEKVEYWSTTYVRQWKKFKKEHVNEIDQLRSSNRQQMAQPV